MKRKILLSAWLLCLAAGSLLAQNAPIATATPVQATQGLYYAIPYSVTCAVNVACATALPTPPPNQYIYICSLALNGSADGTGGALTNVVTTSANFGSFALKFSNAGSVNTTYDWSAKWGEPSTGCAKSVSPGTVTSFTS